LRCQSDREKEIELLEQSGLFDRDLYLARYLDAPSEGTLKFFLETGWHRGHDPGPDFNTSYYLKTNPDVAAAGVNPLVHYILHGATEGRVPHDRMSSECLKRSAASFCADAAAASRVLKWARSRATWPKLTKGSPVSVLVHSSGNLFMTEIAELLTAGFTAAGFKASLADESIVMSEQGANLRDAMRVIVAPHEFFFIPRAGQAVDKSWTEGAIVLNVEQLYTVWFQHGADSLAKAAAILDINVQSAAALAAAGLPAAFLPLGYVAKASPFDLPVADLPDLPALQTLEPVLKRWRPSPEDSLIERPLDILFIGSRSERRQEYFSRVGERLARWRCHWLLADSSAPQVRGRTAVLSSEASIGLARRSKILLNLHQSENLFFEWHRIVLQGIWQRAVVVTEPVSPQPFFIPGKHFFECPLDGIPDLLMWLLETEEGRAAARAVRERAYEHLVSQVRLDAALLDLFSAG
jgi:hypothetical protein